MFENNIVIYKFAQDLHFFVTGGDEENELIISTVLQGFFDAVGLLLRQFAMDISCLLMQLLYPFVLVQNINQVVCHGYILSAYEITLSVYFNLEH